MWTFGDVFEHRDTQCTGSHTVGDFVQLTLQDLQLTLPECSPPFCIKSKWTNEQTTFSTKKTLVVSIRHFTMIQMTEKVHRHGFESTRLSQPTGIEQKAV